MQASIGYVAHPLAAYAKNPIWTVDPKHLPYRDAVKELRPAGYDGKLGYASAGVLADFARVPRGTNAFNSFVDQAMY